MLFAASAILFPIPMRGNEQLGPVRGITIWRVSDPHEG